MIKTNINKKGVITLLVSLTVLIILVLPPQILEGKIIIAGFEQDSSDEVIDAKSQQQIDLFLSQGSVVNTDIILTETDQSIIARFLDEQGIGFTEKFGILTDVAIVSPDGTVTKNSNIFGISQLSVTDEDGILRDLDTIQITMKSVSKKSEVTTNVWGVVQFFLDDNLINTKYLWVSGSNNQKNALSFVQNLSFEFESINGQSVLIAEQQAVVNNLKNNISRLTANQSNTGRFIPDTSLPALREQLVVENNNLLALQDAKSSNIKRAFPPSFTDQEKKNFSFTLSDEGRNWVDKSQHTFRVVLTEIHANLDSDKDNKEFHWTGQHVSYKLTITVDETKITVLNDENNSISIFRSDGTFSVTSPTWNGNTQSLTCSRRPNLCGQDNALLPVSFDVFVKNNDSLISLGTVNNNNLLVTQTSSFHCGGFPVEVCSTNYITTSTWSNPIFVNIPRNSNIIVKTSDGQSFEFHTPLSQHNIFLSCIGEPDNSASNVKVKAISCTSNFGYEFP